MYVLYLSEKGKPHPTFILYMIREDFLHSLRIVIVPFTNVERKVLDGLKLEEDKMYT